MFAFFIQIYNIKLIFCHFFRLQATSHDEDDGEQGEIIHSSISEFSDIPSAAGSSRNTDGIIGSDPSRASSPIPVHSNIGKKKKRRVSPKPQPKVIPQELLTAACTALNQKEDEFDAIGHNVASKLRSLEHTQRIIAEKLISEVLFNAQLNNLNISSTIWTPTNYVRQQMSGFQMDNNSQHLSQHQFRMNVPQTDTASMYPMSASVVDNAANSSDYSLFTL